MDIQSISAALESVKVALDIGKYLKSFNDTIKNSEFQGKLLELNETIIEIKEKLLEAKQENLELQEKVMQLEQQLVDKSAFQYDSKLHAYWKSDNKDSPYCPTCFDKDTAKIRMVKGYKMSDERPRYFCNVCNNESAEIPEGS
jgi:uncharacterized protein YfcZ (UPF0381/DUF406 family)